MPGNGLLVALEVEGIRVLGFKGLLVQKFRDFAFKLVMWLNIIMQLSKLIMDCNNRLNLYLVATYKKSEHNLL